MPQVYTSLAVVASRRDSGDPAVNDWSVTITFPNVGSVPYHCEVHVIEGMTGTVIVR
jgi:plastocyanin